MDESGVCVFLVHATATEDNAEYGSGERHAIMAFLRGDTFDIAEGEVREVLARRGWRDFALERNKRVGLGAGADDAVLSAFQGRVVLHVFPETKSIA
jgi:hypothetical protein